MSPFSDTPGDLAVEHVRSLAPYVPGKPIDELERELGIRNIIKLASNENPVGPSPLAIEAMQRALADSWLYPDGSGHLLKQKLAAKLGVSPEQITLGNGSNDVLVLLAEAFLKPGLQAVYSQYAFAVYPIAVQAAGATGIAVPALGPESKMALGHDLAAMARAINAATRVVFIANPNNPTGTWMPAAELEAFIAAVPAHVIVALDEAYFEYTGGLGLQNGIDWLDRYRNLVVFRTFSKAYGLAGVRVGYAVSHASVADMLNRVRQPFNVSTVGLAGAAAALDDPAHVSAAVAAGGVRARARGRSPGKSGHPRGALGGQLPAAARRCECDTAFRCLAAPGCHRATGGQLPVAGAPARNAGHRRTERSVPQRLASLLASRR